MPLIHPTAALPMHLKTSSKLALSKSSKTATSTRGSRGLVTATLFSLGRAIYAVAIEDILALVTGDGSPPEIGARRFLS
jgi:hypothetical protein